MKIQTLVLSLLVGANTALGVVLLPPPAGTNNLAAVLQAGQIRETAQRSFNSGQIAQLQSQVEMLQTEFLILAIAVGAAGAAVFILLAGRARIDAATGTQEDQAQKLRANK